MLQTEAGVSAESKVINKEESLNRKKKELRDHDMPLNLIKTH